MRWQILQHKRPVAALFVGAALLAGLAWSLPSGKVDDVRDEPTALAQARAWLEGGRPDLALQAVYPVDEDSPHAGEALTIAGVALLRRGNLVGARVMLERARKLRPHDPKPLRALVVVRLRSGDGARASADLQELCRLTPHDPRPWTVIGTVRRALGNQREAVEAFAEASRRAPGDAARGSDHVRALVKWGYLNEAAPLLRKLRQRHPQHPDVLSVAACEAEMQGRPGAALDLARRALSGDPGHRDALVLCGRLHLGADQVEAALAHFERALAADPDDPEVLHSLFLIHARLGNPERAAEFAARHEQVLERGKQWLERMHRSRESTMAVASRRAVEMNPAAPDR